MERLDFLPQNNEEQNNKQLQSLRDLRLPTANDDREKTASNQGTLYKEGTDISSIKENFFEQASVPNDIFLKAGFGFTEQEVLANIHDKRKYMEYIQTINAKRGEAWQFGDEDSKARIGKALDFVESKRLDYEYNKRMGKI